MVISEKTDFTKIMLRNHAIDGHFR